jgi:hypothetical protein
MDQENDVKSYSKYYYQTVVKQRRNEDPEYKAKRNEVNRRCMLDKYRNNEEYRKQMNEYNRNYYQEKREYFLEYQRQKRAAAKAAKAIAALTV